MECINKCGSKYLKDVHGEFRDRLNKYNVQIDKMLI